MKKKIIFQKCNLNYFYFLLYIVTYIIWLIIDHYLDEIYKNEKDNKKKFYFYIDKEILDIYTYNISDFIAIIPYCIRKKLSQNNNNNKNEDLNLDNENKEKAELIYNDAKQSGTKLKTKTILLYLILIAAFDFLDDFMFVVYYIFFDEDYNFFPFNYSSILEIIIQFIVSYLILKIHFYKLQHCSLYLNVIICVIILILDLVDFFVIKIKFKANILLFLPFYLIFYCLKFAIGKKIILYGYISIYLLILIKGVFKLIFVVIFSLIVLIIDKKIFIVFGNYFSELKYILLIIGKIIDHFFKGLSVWFIIDRFSPNYTPLMIIGEEKCRFVYVVIIMKNIFKDVGWSIYFRIVLYVISFFGVLLHNEIVVINICGLASDTKYFYDNLVKSEEEYMKSDDFNILQRFETLEMTDLEEDDPVSKGLGKSINN